MTLKQSYLNDYGIETIFPKQIKNKIIFKLLAVPNIHICINRYLVSRRFGRPPYSTLFSFWLIGYNLSAEVFPKNWRLGRSMHGIRRPNIGSSEVFEHLVHWLIDLGPQNSEFYTNLIELPKTHRISKGMLGLWSSAEALHNKKSRKPSCLIEDP